MPPFSLFQPLPGLAWYMLRLWPLIFWRIQHLKKWFQDNGRPGSQMMWTVLSNGRVILLRASDDLFVHPPCILRAPVSAKLALALTEPPLPCPRRTPGPHAIAFGITARDPGVRQENGLRVVIPDT
jgi:hypothetical protein